MPGEYEYAKEVRETLEILAREMNYPIEYAIEALLSSLNGDIKPLYSFYFAFRDYQYRWWERPHWIWRKHAIRRTQRKILEEVGNSGPSTNT